VEERTPQPGFQASASSHSVKKKTLVLEFRNKVLFLPEKSHGPIPMEVSMKKQDELRIEMGGDGIEEELE